MFLYASPLAFAEHMMGRSISVSDRRIFLLMMPRV
jgi:hypothetical protein